MTDYKRGDARLVALNVEAQGGFLTEKEYGATREKLDGLRRSNPDAFKDLHHLAQYWRTGNPADALPQDRIDALDRVLRKHEMSRESSVLKVLIDHAAHGFQATYHPGFMKNAGGRPFMPSIFNATAHNVESFVQNHPEFVEPLREILTKRDASLIVSPSSVFADQAQGRAFMAALRQHHLLGGEYVGTGRLSLQVQAVAPEVLRNGASARMGQA